MSLKETLTSLRERKAESQLNPLESDPRVRSGVESIARNAKIAVSELIEEYARKVEGLILLINVTGPGAKKFAQYAHDKMKVLAFDHADIVQILADRIRSRGGSETFTSTEGHLLLSEVLELRVAATISHLPPLLVNETNPTPYECPLEEAIKRIIEFSYGIGLYDAITLRSAQTGALNSEFSGTVLPVVVYNYQGGHGAPGALLPPPAFHVEAPFGISAEFVKEKLLKIKEQLKQGKSNQTALSAEPGE